MYTLMVFVKNACYGPSDQRQKTNNRLLMSLYTSRVSHTLSPPPPHVHGSRRNQTGSKVLPVVRRSVFSVGRIEPLPPQPSSVSMDGSVGAALRALLTHREHRRMAEEREREKVGGGRG